jgi:hypothetical protein
MRLEQTMTPLPMRFIVHDLDAGVRFYSAMFASAPDERKPSYAKWTLGRFGASVTVLAPRRSRGLAGTASR